MSDQIEKILECFSETATAIESKLSSGLSWSKTGGHVGQHQGDVDADVVGTEILERCGYQVFSEESGFSGGVANDPDVDTIVVIDPIDGSTNASRGIPFYAVSLCAVRSGIPVAAMVRNLASGDTYTASADGGSFKNGDPILPSATTEISDAIIGINGYSPKFLGWAQYRAFGSAALELCMVAEGSLDGFIDMSRASLASWDVLGGILICMEAQATVLGSDRSRYILRDLGDRGRVVAAGTWELAHELGMRGWTE